MCNDNHTLGCDYQLEVEVMEGKMMEAEVIGTHVMEAEETRWEGVDVKGMSGRSSRIV